MKRIRVCLAGATGWTGSCVARSILGQASAGFELVGAVARSSAGKDLGEVLGDKPLGIRVSASVEQALTQAPADVLIDYTAPGAVKANALAALERGVSVVIGTSGLGAADFEEVERHAVRVGKGVVAAGNFSITAALAKHLALIAARYLPHREIVDYAHAGKPDAPSGTTRELAERLAEVRANELFLAVDKTLGYRDARGATIGGTQVHSLRLPSYTISFETIFGLPDERLTIRHDAGTGAEPYVGGTLEAARRVVGLQGLVRGLDTLLFGQGS